MSQHPIQGLMHTAMESLKQMVDVNTVVGDAVEAKDGTVIVPVSRVSVGFVAGGGEYGREPRRAEAGDAAWPFAGGSGAGVSVQPVGFLVVGQGRVRLLPVAEGAFLDRIIDAAPEVLDRVRRFWTGRDGTLAGGAGGATATVGRAATGGDGASGAPGMAGAPPLGGTPDERAAAGTGSAGSRTQPASAAGTAPVPRPPWSAGAVGDESPPLD
ncbi:MAG TPA: GerW family sporulation protein [Thermaerobacter sp.]